MKTDGPAPVRTPPAWARRLGFGGLIPFVGLAAAAWVGWPAGLPPPSAALLGYGAAIASFLGAIHWGLAMGVGRAQADRLLLWGVAPSLLGWGALLLGSAPGLLTIAALLWICLAVDRVVYPRYQLESWLPLRWQLTSVASVSCLLGAAALLR
jgi:Protein of unknown function (DUF3429)